jgi:hypothetical protein
MMHAFLSCHHVYQDLSGMDVIFTSFVATFVVMGMTFEHVTFSSQKIKNKIV